MRKRKYKGVWKNLFCKNFKNLKGKELEIWLRLERSLREKKSPRVTRMLFNSKYLKPKEGYDIELMD